MDEPGTNDRLEPGEIRFVDNWIPLLEAGDYAVTVTQSLEGSGAYEAARWFSETQEFTVSGPRFHLDPADLYAKFPPPNSQGIYEHDLPHIVLTKRALPWDRSVFKTDGAHDRTIPWMALVLFDAAEILLPEVGTNAGSKAPNPTGVTAVQVSELLDPESGVMVGRYDLDTLDDDDRQQTCQVVDIAPQTFTSVMPSREQVKYLAHCREVNMGPKGVPGPASPGAATASGNGTKWYSVVVGGRFPRAPAPGQAGEVNVAHLVSLEGFQDHLNNPGNAEFPPGTERIRLVSLANWTFTCLQERGESFSKLMQGLVAGGSEASLEFKLPAQRLGPDATREEKFAYHVLEAGYVPHSYHTRQGEQTFAWYRGPFTPQPVARRPADRAPFLTSAQAAVYDKDHGLFDLSYAVAWETGRLLALSDQRFGVLLLNWRRRTHRLVDLLRDRIEHSSQQGMRAAASGPQRFHDLLEHNLVSDTFMRHLVGHFAQGAEPAIFEPPARQPANVRLESAAPVNPHADLADFYHDGDVQQFLAEVGSEEVDPICDWLAHLYLLYGVPFNNLVADERMLPLESIRFFYLDRNWLEALLDGALSIGIESSRDALYQKRMQCIVRDAVQQSIHSVRDSLLGVESEAPGDAGEGPMAGLLLRSAVVSGWPGLEVRAYCHIDEQKPSGPIGLLRMDRLSDDVLLCLFPKVPAWIEFDEPKEGLHFGVEVEGDDEVVGLRYLGGDKVGGLLGPKETVEPGRDDYRNLVIEDLVGLLETMKSKLDLAEEDEFGPAAFALQMVKSPEQMVFQTAETS